MSLRIVILNYRTAGLTIGCLRSLRDQVAGVAGRQVLVVDNASGDGSAECIAKTIEQEGWVGWVSVVPLDCNGGYAAGNNVGIRHVLAADPLLDYVLLLNPDTIVQPGALQALVDFMDQHSKVGIAGSRLENPDGTTQCSAHRRPSPLGELEGTAKLGIISRLLSQYRVSPTPRAEPYPCDWVSGASLMIRREVFEQIGLFDEGYFLYYEEVDFCMRVIQGGWQVWYVPAARVFHLEGASTNFGARHARRAHYWYDSRRRFFLKHYGLVGLLLMDCMWVLGRLIYMARHVGGLAGNLAATPKWFAWDLLWGDAKALMIRSTHCLAASRNGGYKNVGPAVSSAEK